MISRSRRFQALGIGVLALTLMGAGYIAFSGVTQSGAVSPSDKEDDAFWRERIAKVGATAAYEEFIERTTPFVRKDQHRAAHTFGGALYAVDGLSALGICDRRSYGCFHEFIGRAILEHGKGIIPELKEHCADRLGRSSVACLHSIGHGIVASLGYTEDAFAAAIAECGPESGTPKDAAFLCQEGALMEYNFRFMMDGESIRPLAYEDDVYAPCSLLPSVQQSACFYDLSMWWHSHKRGSGEIDDHEIFRELGERCSGLRGEQSRLSCFAGLGSTLAWRADGSPQEKADMCRIATNDRPVQLLCIRHLALALARINEGVPRIQDIPSDACASLAGEEHAACVSYDGGPIEL